MKNNHREFKSKLESEGIDLVRMNIAEGKYDKNERKIAEAWLQIKEIRFQRGIVKHQKKINVFLLIVSMLAFGAAGVSLYFDYEEQSSAEKEVLSIFIKRLDTNYETSIIKTEIPQIKVYLSCMLANNSKKTLSIKDYAVWDLLENGPKSLDCPMLEQLGESVNFPINLDPGEGDSFYLEMSLPITQNIYKLIMEEFSTQPEFLIQDLISFLVSKKKDIYGNILVPVYEYGNFSHFVTLMLKDEKKFHIRFESSTGKYFDKEFNWYIGDAFLNISTEKGVDIDSQLKRMFEEGIHKIKSINIEKKNE